ncbi:MAG: AAA family ATPase [Alphaproteobacteria bacterium]
MGVGETVRLGPDGYAEAVTARVYETMRAQAAAALRAGWSVIVDAVHAQPAERQAISDVAALAAVRFDGLWLSAPRAVLETRVDRRRGDASDADARVVGAQLAFDPGPIDWQSLDTRGAFDELVVAAEARLGLL